MTVLSKGDLALVKDSLIRELNILKVKKRIVEEEIQSFERKYGMKSDDFLKKFDSDEVENSQDFFGCWGLLQGLEKLDKEDGGVRRVIDIANSEVFQQD